MATGVKPDRAVLVAAVGLMALTEQSPPVVMVEPAAVVGTALIQVWPAAWVVQAVMPARSAMVGLAAQAVMVRWVRSAPTATRWAKTALLAKSAAQVG